MNVRSRRAGNCDPVVRFNPLVNWLIPSSGRSWIIRSTWPQNGLRKVPFFGLEHRALTSLQCSAKPIAADRMLGVRRAFL